MRKLIMFIGLVLVLSSCEKDTSVKTITNLNVLWTPEVSDGSTGITNQGSASIVYQDNIFYAGVENGKQAYYMVDGESGEVLWKWNDFIGEQTAMNPVKVYQYQHYLILQKSYTTYCIDLSDGTTAWKKQNSKHLGYVTWGIDDYYFVTPVREDVDSLGHYIGGIYYSRVTNQTTEQLVIFPPYDMEYSTITNFSGSIAEIYPFKNENGDILISICYGEVYGSNLGGDTFLGLYNFTKREWIYDRERVISNGGANYYVYEDKVYLGGTNLTICDIYTGTILHTQGFAASGNITRMLRVDDKLILEKGGVLYAIDPTSGSIIWETFSGHNISFMREMNGVIYFTSSGDGKIHAVDVPTGQHYWHSDSPDGASGSRGIFTDMVTLLSGKNGKKGRVYTSSYANGYCYEAVK